MRRACVKPSSSVPPLGLRSSVGVGGRILTETRTLPTGMRRVQLCTPGGDGCVSRPRVSIVGTRRARRFLEEQGWRGGRRRAAARAGTTPPSVPRFHRVPRGRRRREIVAPDGGWRRRVPRGGRLARARRVPRHATEPDRGFDVEQLVRRGRGLRWRPRSVAARPIPRGGWDDSRGGEDGGRVRRVAEGVGWRVREVARRAPLLHPPGLVRRGRHAVDTRRPPPCDRGRARPSSVPTKTETSVCRSDFKRAAPTATANDDFPMGKMGRAATSDDPVNETITFA